MNPRERFGTMPFHVRAMPFLNREDTIKRAFCSFAEKGRVLDLRDPFHN